MQILINVRLPVTLSSRVLHPWSLPAEGQTGVWNQQHADTAPAAVNIFFCVQDFCRGGGGTGNSHHECSDAAGYKSSHATGEVANEDSAVVRKVDRQRKQTHWPTSQLQPFSGGGECFWCGRIQLIIAISGRPNVTSVGGLDTSDHNAARNTRGQLCTAA